MLQGPNGAISYVILPGARQISQEQSANTIRTFDVELGFCERYYEKTYAYATALGAATLPGCVGFTMDTTPTAGQPLVMWQWFFKRRKRVVPTVTGYSPGTGATGKAQDLNGSADVALTVGTITNECLANLAATPNAARVNIDLYCHATADARM